MHCTYIYTCVPVRVCVYTVDCCPCCKAIITQELSSLCHFDNFGYWNGHNLVWSNLIYNGWWQRYTNACVHVCFSLSVSVGEPVTESWVSSCLFCCSFTGRPSNTFIHVKIRERAATHTNDSMTQSCSGTHCKNTHLHWHVGKLTTRHFLICTSKIFRFRMNVSLTAIKPKYSAI